MNRRLYCALLPLVLVACNRSGGDSAQASPRSATVDVSAPASASPSDVPPCSEVTTPPVMLDSKVPLPLLDPDVGIGPIRLGMTEGELTELGLPISEAYAGKKVGPYRVLFQGGAVSFVEVGLADLPGLRIGNGTVADSERDIETIAKLLPGCGELQRNLGGNVIECHEGRVMVAAAGPPGVVELKVMREALR